MRTTTCFGNGWLFRLDEGSAGLVATDAYAGSDLDDAAWRTVRIPHDWSVEGPFDESAPAGGDGGYLPCGVGWYRKHFPFSIRSGEDGISKSDPDGPVIIRFDGAYQKCDVWLNGHPLGHHAFGYMGFEYDLTPFLQEGDNVLAVRVDNGAQPNSRWYSGSGITRDVRLIHAEKTWLSWWGVSVTTEDCGERDVLVRISADVEGRLEPGSEIRFTILDQESVLAESTVSTGSAVSTGSTVSARSTVSTESSPGTVAIGTVATEFVLHDAKRWSHRMPALYQLKVSLSGPDESTVYKKNLQDETLHGKTLHDETIVSFGVRTILFDKDRGFVLNGERVKLRGVCLHHDGGCVGASVPAAIWHRRLLKLKEMGCNAIRMSHNPPDPEFLDLCDRLGFYVMDEAFDEWRIRKAKNGLADHGYGDLWEENHIRDFTDMIRRDRNHPSIVLWSIGNEIPEQTVPGGEVLAQELVGLCHRLDPTRMAVSACDNIKSEPNPATEAFLNTLDVVGGNYINRWRNRTELFYSEERHEHPEWRLIGSEHGAVGGFRGRYELDGQEPHPWFGDYRSRMVRVTPLLKFTEANDYVAGDFMWTGIDYLGECRWPHKNASSGCLDTCGFPKDAFHFYRSVWTEAPMIHLFPHWNWRGHEGQVISILCCTNCDSAELFLNGKSFGRKAKQFPLQGMTKAYAHFERKFPQPTTTDLHLQWDVPYEPGVLEVVGYRQGAAACSQRNVTTGVPHALAVSLEDPAAGAGVLHQLVVRVEDAEGLLVPDAEIVASVKVAGSGRFLAMDNGMPEDHTPFQSPARKTLGGLALVLVERTAPGMLDVTVTGNGLEIGRISLP